MVALQNETTSEQYARICADIKGALDVSADTKDEFLQELDPSYLKQQDNFESMDSKSDKSNYHSSSTVATATEAPTSYAKITNPVLASKKNTEEKPEKASDYQEQYPSLPTGTERPVITIIGSNIEVHGNNTFTFAVNNEKKTTNDVTNGRVDNNDSRVQNLTRSSSR